VKSVGLIFPLCDFEARPTARSTLNPTSTQQRTEATSPSHEMPMGQTTMTSKFSHPSMKQTNSTTPEKQTSKQKIALVTERFAPKTTMATTSAVNKIQASLFVFLFSVFVSAFA